MLLTAHPLKTLKKKEKKKKGVFGMAQNYIWW